MASQSRPAILVADDDPRNLLAMEALLEPLGAELVLAGSGEQALREVLVRRFDVALLDVQMPGLDGFDTARLLRASRNGRDTAILYISAQDDPRGDEEAADYFRKPLDTDRLIAHVSRLIRHVLPRQASASPAA